MLSTMNNAQPAGKSRLVFTAQGRKRRLIRLAPNGPFHIRYQHQGKRLLRSLGTTLVEVAISKAKKLIDNSYNGDLAKVRQSKVRSDYPTLRVIADRYLEKYGTDARRRKTARGNIGALEKIVRLTTGHELEVARVNILDAQLVRKFQAEEEKRILRDGAGNMNQASELRVRTSIGSVLRQARSIFKLGTMSWFDDLNLPDLGSFRRQGVTSPDRPKPQPLDDFVINQLIAAAPALAIADPPVYAAHLLFRFLGMRNGEIRMARRNWIVRTADGGGKLGVIYRPEEGFKPKKKTERWIPIAPAVLNEILRFAEPAADGFLVPAAHKTERQTIVDKRHSAWAGQWIKDRSKTSYELRRYAGSLVYKKTGRIEYVQQFLGHADLQTTMSWYWYLLGEVPALEPADFAPAPQALASVA